MQNAFTHREAWLHALAAGLRPSFEEAGYPIPTNIRLTCGFASRRGAAAKRRVLGQSWSAEASKDGHYEIMISPTIDDPVRVAEILAHELVHVVVGLEGGYTHNAEFRAVAQKVGLEGRTGAMGGASFKRFLTPLLESCGPYPHAELVVGQTSGPPKQSTRLIRCQCPHVEPDGKRCPNLIRASRFCLDTFGPPVCSRHGDEMVEQ